MISLITYSAKVAQATNDSFKKPKKEIWPWQLLGKPSPVYCKVS